MGRECSAHEEIGDAYKLSFECLKEIDSSGVLGADGGIILKWILWNWNLEVCFK